MNKRLQQRKEVLALFDGHCAYCGKEITLKTMQIDHQTPKVYNWKMINLFSEEVSYCDHPANLFPSCRRCNHYKRDRDLEEFRKLIATLHQRIQTYTIKVAIDYGIVIINQWDGKFYFEKQSGEATYKNIH